MKKTYKKSVVALLTALAIPAASLAQDKKIEGAVSDASTGGSLPGARITILNGEGAAMSGDKGTFAISVPGRQALLRVELPGYEVRYVAVKGDQPVSISLNPETSYGFAAKGTLTSGASASASGFPIEEINADQSVSDLQGNLFAISRSGMPGSGHSIYVDGLHSISLSSQPLYVVDGVIWGEAPETTSVMAGYFSNPLSLIDPRDIAKITVLKNGGAIYGAKGGNGVIIIDTRRAKDAATQIEAYAMLGIKNPGKTMPVMNAAQYRTYVSDILKGKYENSSEVGGLNFLDDDISSPGYAMTHNDTDWQGLTTRTGMLMNYGINVRGGDDRALYAFSLGYAKSDGSIKETSFDRLNVRFNSDINLWKGFQTRFDIAFAQATRNMRDDGINGVSSPGYMAMIKSPLFHPNILTTAGGVTNKYADVDELGVGNPLSILDLGIGNNRNYRFNLNVVPRYDFNSKLAVAGRVSYTFDKMKENSFLPDYGVEETNLYNNNGEIYAVSKNYVKSQMGRYTSSDMDAHIEYTPLRDVDNTLAFMLGYRYMNDTYNFSYGEGHNTSSDYMNDLSNTSSALHFSHGLDSEWRSIGWYLTAGYSWRNRYFIDADVAIETSSRFGKNASGALKMGGVAWGVFPTVSAAWVISNENWMKSASAVSLLKLYGSYSVSGNDNVPLYATQTYFDSEGLMDNAFGWVVANLGNDKLKWENTSTLRGGLEMSLFNDRWHIGADVYRSETTDLLMHKTLADEAGIASYWTNDGTMRNIGYNVSTSVRALNLRDWKLDLGLSVGHYDNKLTKLSEAFTTDVMGGQVLTEQGRPVGVFYGYRTEGVFASQNAAEAAGLSIRNTDGSLSRFGAGDMHFADVKADGVIDANDRVVIGDPNPDFFGNFNFRLQWKGLSLASMFTYVVGNDVYNALRANLESGSNVYNQSVAMANRWVANNQTTDIPRATYGDPMGNARFSDRWIEDGSYLKWKSLELSYNLPLHTSFIQGLTFTMSMHNILTWTKYLGPDPEFSYGTSPLYMGVDAGLTAPGREYCFGIKINL
ncbi:MAG: SusC/RagA family TonB-linked outer membrane protein [Duncaniella sp.]|nr:SusC/RagA family TonB-linked outer membrane protein [Duncaniella sp.]